MNEILINALRYCADNEKQEGCDECPYLYNGMCRTMLSDAAYALEAAEKRIAELEARLPKWISVEDRLPEKMKNVLAANNRGKQWDIDKAWFNGAHFDRCGKRPLFHVTHWMPLPNAPKGE